MNILGSVHLYHILIKTMYLVVNFTDSVDYRMNVRWCFFILDT